jgi:hypothetical protein
VVPDHVSFCSAFDLIVSSIFSFRFLLYTSLIDDVFDRWCHFRTASGTFKDGELRLNQRGLRLISEEIGNENVSPALTTIAFAVC